MQRTERLLEAKKPPTKYMKEDRNKSYMVRPQKCEK